MHQHETFNPPVQQMAALLPKGHLRSWRYVLPCLRSAVFANLSELGGGVRRRLRSVSIDGTSSTALLVDRRSGAVLAQPKLYNEGQPDAAVAAVQVVLE